MDAGKVVVITGASSGIGEAARMLARHGARIVIGARPADQESGTVRHDGDWS